MRDFSKFFAFIISFFIILIASFFLFLKLIQITPNEKELKIYSPYIKNNLNIHYDYIGFPRIHAENLNDLLYGIGYAQAENRMWQMDLLRRMAQGRLSEILGDEFITYDKFIRFFNLVEISDKIFSKIPSDLKSLLISYSHGVNTFIQENSENLAIEFSIFNYSPKKWEPSDCILIFNFLDFLNNSSFKDNLLDKIFQERLTPIEYNDLNGILQPTNSVDSNYKNRFSSLDDSKFKKLVSLIDSISHYAFLFNSSHSNSFAIRKLKNNSYQSIIASDNATELSIPSFGMTIITSSPEIKIIGHYLPGIPFSLSGRNNFLAWTLNFTNSNRWSFEEIVLDNNKSHFKDTDSTWKKVKYITDTIFVKNSYQRLFYLKFIKGYGLFTEAFSELNLNLIVHSPAIDTENNAFFNLYKLNFSQSIDEISKVNKNWYFPTANLLFGDKSGNIGVVSLGNAFKNINKIQKPITNDKQIIINPKNNFVISTNYNIDSNYSNNWISNYRSRRIESFLANLPDFELRDIKNIQLDAKSEFSKELLSIIIPIIKDKIYLLSNDEKVILESLKNWDFSYTRNQKQPIIVEEFIKTFLYKTLIDNIDRNLINHFYEKYDFYERLIKFLNNKQSSLYDDLKTTQIENRDYIIFTSAKNTFQRLSKIFAENKISKFKNWGKYTQTGFSHFAQNNKLVNATFVIDSIEISGHRTCISSVWKNNVINKSFGTTNRIIFDNTFSGSYIINSLGNSGDPTNDHFVDQLQVWKNGGYIKIYFDSKLEKVTNKRIFKPSK